MKLRCYQKEAIESVINNDRGIVSLPTGAGKTTVISNAIKEMNGNIGIFAHTQSLVIQLYERMKDETGLDIGLLYEESDDWKKPVLASTWQSMKILQSSKKISKKHFKVIFIDECHNILSKEYRSVIEWFDCPKIYGLTATWRGRGQDVILNFFENVIYEKTLFDLIDEGYLAKMRFYVHIDDISTKHKRQNQEYQDKKWKLINQYQRKDHKTIHFFGDTASFDYNPVNAKTIKFDTNHNERKNIFKVFNDLTSDVNDIFSCRILNEGIDLPNTNTIVFHETCGDFRILTQRIGRGIRKTREDKVTDIIMFINSDNEKQINNFANFIDQVEEAKNSRMENKIDDEIEPIQINLLDKTEEFIQKMKNILSFEYYPTLDEVRKAVKKLNIHTSEDYNKLYRNDPRLPSNPYDRYPDWINWNNLFDSGAIGFYPTLDEAKKAAFTLGITKYDEYKQKYKLDPRLPSTPKKVYPDFDGWISFFNKKQERYSTIEEMKKAVKRLNIKGKTEYEKMYKLDPRLPPHPDRLDGWVNWSDFLDKV